MVIICVRYLLWSVAVWLSYVYVYVYVYIKVILSMMSPLSGKVTLAFPFLYSKPDPFKLVSSLPTLVDLLPFVSLVVWWRELSSSVV